MPRDQYSEPQEEDADSSTDPVEFARRRAERRQSHRETARINETGARSF